MEEKLCYHCFVLLGPSWNYFCTYTRIYTLWRSLSHAALDGHVPQNIMALSGTNAQIHNTRVCVYIVGTSPLPGLSLCWRITWPWWCWEVGWYRKALSFIYKKYPSYMVCVYFYTSDGAIPIRFIGPQHCQTPWKNSIDYQTMVKGGQRDLVSMTK